MQTNSPTEIETDSDSTARAGWQQLTAQKDFFRARHILLCHQNLRRAIARFGFPACKILDSLHLENLFHVPLILSIPGVVEAYHNDTSSHPAVPLVIQLYNDSSRL
jgi:hypothetical protein